MSFIMRRAPVAVDEENPYWISFSDIMAGLLVIFILACLALIYQITDTKIQVKDELEALIRAEQVRADILDEVKNELESKGIFVEIEQDTIIIPDALLGFRTGSSKIPFDQHDNARAIGNVLYQAIAKEGRAAYLDTIFVEGHTDKIPYNIDPLGNWGLSADRAVQLWKFWGKELDQESQLDRLRNYAQVFLFSVSGYGKNRPRPQGVEALPEKEVLKKNRRIDIRITVKKPSKEDLEKIIQALGGTN
jgi:flagellar motor protein MotB